MIQDWRPPNSLSHQKGRGEGIHILPWYFTSKGRWSTESQGTVRYTEVYAYCDWEHASDDQVEVPLVGAVFLAVIDAVKTVRVCPLFYSESGVWHGI